MSEAEPRSIVDALIESVMNRHDLTRRGSRKVEEERLAAYFDDVHQTLAPLARRLERALRDGGAPQALFDEILREFLP